MRMRIPRRYIKAASMMVVCLHSHRVPRHPHTLAVHHCQMLGGSSVDHQHCVLVRDPHLPTSALTQDCVVLSNMRSLSDDIAGFFTRMRLTVTHWLPLPRRIHALLSARLTHYITTTLVIVFNAIIECFVTLATVGNRHVLEGSSFGHPLLGCAAPLKVEVGEDTSREDYECASDNALDGALGDSICGCSSGARCQIQVR